MSKDIALGKMYFASTSGFYVDSHIFTTKRDMHRYIKSQGSVPDGCEAMNLAFTKYNSKGHMTKQLGTLCFYRDFMGAGIVAHECTHAGFNWLRQKYPRFALTHGSGIIDADDPEEMMCVVVGNLVSQFWNKWFALEDRV